MNLRRGILVVGLAVMLGVSVLVGGGVLYVALGSGPDADALDAVEADDSISVERFEGGTVVTGGPVTAETTGLVYYPGAGVNHESYVPTAAEIVGDRDIVVVIVEMPLNLAVLSPNSADAAIETVPAVDSWYVGGHSLGGAMACRYAAGNADTVEGLVLHGSYCDRDLSQTELRTISVLGTADGVINTARERERRALLPAETTIVELDGVNHAGFGAYGDQLGDNPASRSPAESRHLVGNTTGSWLSADDTDDARADSVSALTG